MPNVVSCLDQSQWEFYGNCVRWFHGDETLLTFYETPSFFFLIISAKLMIFNAMKLIMKLPLKLALGQSQWEWYRSVIDIKFVSVMKYEGSVITMTLHWYSSQISNLDNCVDDAPTETELIPTLTVSGEAITICRALALSPPMVAHAIIDRSGSYQFRGRVP